MGTAGARGSDWKSPAHRICADWQKAAAPAHGAGIVGVDLADGGGCGRIVLCLEPDVTMYNQFFGLRKEPFGMTPNPAFLFLSAAHREALAGLPYAILSPKGFAVLTGDPGTRSTRPLTPAVKSGAGYPAGI